MAVSSHCDRLSLRVLFSNFQRYLRKILSRWHHFSFLLFVFLHQSASHNFSLSIELTSKRLIYYNTVVYRLYLAQFVQRQTYDLLHSNSDHFLRTNLPTYKFTYLQIGSFHIQIHLPTDLAVVPTNRGSGGLPPPFFYSGGKTQKFERREREEKTD